MNREQAKYIIKNTFENPFNRERFIGFVKNLLNHIEVSSFSYHGNYIPDSFEQYIKKYERIGKYSDGENRIDILVVHLNKQTSIERARTIAA